MTETAARSRHINLLIYGLFFSLFVLMAVTRALQWSVPNPIDEQAHYSMAAHIHEYQPMLMDYRDARLLDGETLADWTDEPGYLTHPTFYYRVLSLFMADERGIPEARMLRLVNTALAALAVLAFFAAGFLTLESPVRTAAFAIFITMTPKIAALASLINNDNLALLGSALVLLGLARQISTGVDRLAMGLQAIGFVIGAHAKLNAGIELGLILSIFHVLNQQAIRAYGTGPKALGITGLVILVAAFPYLHNVLLYGSPVFQNDALFPRTFGMQMYGFESYTPWFFYSLIMNWSNSLPTPAMTWIAFPVFLVLAVASAAAGPRTARDRVVRQAGLATLATLVITLALHFGFSNGLFERTGYAFGATFRYYTPLVGFLALAACSFKTARLSERSVTALVASGAALYLLATLSDIRA